MSENTNTDIKNAERALLLDHDYDGIRELDHRLPRWWLFIFYATILFAAGYVGYYMVGPGVSLREEFEHELKAIYARRPKDEPLVADEKSLQATLKSPDHAKSGAKVFSTRCAPCHGANGQGVIGPNLTDNYWLHGTGSLRDIAKVVHDGVVEKGMPAWGEILQPDELKDVSIYVTTLQGTKPANPKAPQGRLQTQRELR